jgi:hypothetical protein
MIAAAVTGEFLQQVKKQIPPDNIGDRLLKNKKNRNLTSCENRSPWSAALFVYDCSILASISKDVYSYGFMYGNL